MRHPPGEATPGQPVVAAADRTLRRPGDFEKAEDSARSPVTWRTARAVPDRSRLRLAIDLVALRLCVAGRLVALPADTGGALTVVAAVGLFDVPTAGLVHAPPTSRSGLTVGGSCGRACQRPARRWAAVRGTVRALMRLRSQMRQGVHETLFETKVQGGAMFCEHNARSRLASYWGGQRVVPWTSSADLVLQDLL